MSRVSEVVVHLTDEKVHLTDEKRCTHRNVEAEIVDGILQIREKIEDSHGKALCITYYPLENVLRFEVWKR